MATSNNKIKNGSFENITIQEGLAWKATKTAIKIGGAVGGVVGGAAVGLAGGLVKGGYKAAKHLIKGRFDDDPEPEEKPKAPQPVATQPPMNKATRKKKGVIPPAKPTA